MDGRQGFPKSLTFFLFFMTKRVILYAFFQHQPMITTADNYL